MSKKILYKFNNNIFVEKEQMSALYLAIVASGSEWSIRGGWIKIWLKMDRTHIAGKNYEVREDIYRNGLNCMKLLVNESNFTV